MNRHFNILIVMLLTISWLGCDDGPEIRQYRVAKARSDLGDIGIDAQLAAPTPPPVAKPVLSQMFVAIASRPDATWFFKLTGPIKAMEAGAEEWKKLLSKIQFDESGKPVWVASDDWKVGPEKQFRYATLFRSIPEKGNIELSISSLAPNQDLLSNVNRWLGQLGKPPIKEKDMSLSDMKFSAGDFKTFDDTGMLAAGGMMASTPPTPPAPEESLLSYDVPDGWKKGPTNMIVKARLLHGEDASAPQISVTQLLAAANDWIPNAQRWARQVDMDTSEEFAQDNSTEISVDGIKGNKIRLIPADESKERGLVGIMIVREELAWFFKLFGDKEQIAKLEPDFDKFVESFSFQQK